MTASIPEAERNARIVDRQAALVRIAGIVSPCRHIGERRVLAEILHGVDDEGRNPQQAGPLLAEDQNRKLVEGRAVLPDVQQHDPEAAARKGQPVGLMAMIHPAAERSGFGLHLVDMHNRLAQAVARGEKFGQSATMIGARDQRRHGNAVDQIGDRHGGGRLCRRNRRVLNEIVGSDVGGGGGVLGRVHKVCRLMKSETYTEMGGEGKVIITCKRQELIVGIKSDAGSVHAMLNARRV